MADAGGVNQIWICPVCGGKFTEGARYCPHDGHQLQVQQAGEIRKGQGSVSRPENRWSIRDRI